MNANPSALANLFFAIADPRKPELRDAAMNHDLSQPDYARLWDAAKVETLSLAATRAGQNPVSNDEE